MARFHPLTVTDIHKTIRDAVVVSLAAPEGADFDFVQGQYLTFRRDFDGEELRRSYSICAGLDDGIRYRLASNGLRAVRSRLGQMRDCRWVTRLKRCRPKGAFTPR